VSLAVGSRPPENVGPVTVELRDPASGATVASTTTTFAAGYAFDLPNVRGGAYELRAGTDGDRDGAICDLGELCGAYPVLTAPRSVTIVGGENLPARDFVLVTVSNEP
jgi:serine protease